MIEILLLIWLVGAILLFFVSVSTVDASVGLDFLKAIPLILLWPLVFLAVAVEMLWSRK